MIQPFMVTIGVSRRDQEFPGVSTAVPRLPQSCSDKPDRVKTHPGPAAFRELLPG